MNLRAQDRGLTLIEMLVALALVAGIATAALGLLRGAVSSELTLRGHDAQAGQLRRFLALWRADLLQAQPLVLRNASGQAQSALVAPGAGALLVQMVRGGWSNPDGQPRAPYEKLAYRWDGRALVRDSFPQPDGARPTEHLALLPLKEPPRLRWRDAAGAWHATWPPDGGDPLPSAAELVIRPAGFSGPLTVVVPVGRP